MRKKIKPLALIFSLILIIHINAQESLTKLPEGFVYVKEQIPTLRTDLRYYSSKNVIGKPFDGYLKPKLILTQKATDALKKVHDELGKLGFGLLVYDAYRPQKATNQLMNWVKDSSNTDMKKVYYPNISKEDLINLQYITSKSDHSRGSSIDLTIVSLTKGHILDMGSAYGLFDGKSTTDYPNITRNQHAVRQLLKRRMEKYGFVSHPKKWWHFTLKDEPFKETYFDFPIE